MYARRTSTRRTNVADWLFGIGLIAVGMANLLLVHSVPAIAYAVVSLVYLPPVRAFAKRKFGFSIHPFARIALAIAIVMFTLGVSDLGEMVD